MIKAIYQTAAINELYNSILEDRRNCKSCICTISPLGFIKVKFVFKDGTKSTYKLNPAEVKSISLEDILQ